MFEEVDGDRAVPAWEQVERNLFFAVRPADAGAPATVGLFVPLGPTLALTLALAADARTAVPAPACLPAHPTALCSGLYPGQGRLLTAVPLPLTPPTPPIARMAACIQGLRLTIETGFIDAIRAWAQLPESTPPPKTAPPPTMDFNIQVRCMQLVLSTCSV